MPPADNQLATTAALKSAYEAGLLKLQGSGTKPWEGAFAWPLAQVWSTEAFLGWFEHDGTLSDPANRSITYGRALQYSLKDSAAGAVFASDDSYCAQGDWSFYRILLDWGVGPQMANAWVQFSSDGVGWNDFLNAKSTPAPYRFDLELYAGGTFYFRIRGITAGGNIYHGAVSSVTLLRDYCNPRGPGDGNGGGGPIDPPPIEVT